MVVNVLSKVYSPDNSKVRLYSAGFRQLKVISNNNDYALFFYCIYKRTYLSYFSSEVFYSSAVTSFSTLQTMIAIFILCLVGMAVAQRPVPCTTPPQWEARIFDTNEEQKFAVEGRLTYDGLYHRERLIDEVDEPNTRDFYDTIALFDLKVEFVFNFRARNCTRREITRPWRDFGIRANDTSYGEAYIGSSVLPGTGVLVTIW